MKKITTYLLFFLLTLACSKSDNSEAEIEIIEANSIHFFGESLRNMQEYYQRKLMKKLDFNGLLKKMMKKTIFLNLRFKWMKLQRMYHLS